MTQLDIKDLNDLQDVIAFAADYFTKGRQNELVVKLQRLIAEREEFERRQKEEEERRSQVVPEVVLNWRYVRKGTLVKRSDQFLENHSNVPDFQKQVGIVTDHSYLEDDLCHMITYPHIHWVGASSSIMEHPAYAQLANGDKLPTITMNANQRAKEK